MAKRTCRSRSPANTPAQAGYDFHTVQELLGRGVRSPLDSGGGPALPPVLRDVTAEYRAC